MFRFTSGHLKSLTLEINKRFPICPEWQLEQASPQNILECIELDWKDIHDSSIPVSHFVNVKDFIDLA
ncbi:hypothetical protein TNCV_2267871 [Trichonephila clavipes]|nr:hypothetical protein TNCV_2267871 [Trichonephila clavipes]